MLDPRIELPRRSRFADMDGALRVRPRYRGYAEALARLASAGQA